MPNFRRLPILSANDTVEGVGRRYQTHTVCVHEAGPHELPHASLIPNAAVISSHPIERPTPVELSIGDEVFVTGIGPHKIVRDRQNPDWPKLVPTFGPRFYVRFEGFGQWSILDREEDGAYAQIRTLSASSWQCTSTPSPTSWKRSPLPC